MLRLWAGSHGAFTIKFSNKGYLLAVACRHGETFPILSELKSLFNLQIDNFVFIEKTSNYHTTFEIFDII